MITGEKFFGIILNRRWEDWKRGSGKRGGFTMRLSLPTSRPSRISRASSEWPTSSKASVASWPPTSRRTSSPPLSGEGLG